MDLEQIVKRLEWLDDERRKDKTALAMLEERLVPLEGNLPALNQQIKEMNAEMARISAMLARFDQFEASLSQIRVDLSRSLEAVEKQRQDSAREVEKVRRADMESLNKAIGDVRKGLDPITELKKSVQARVEEEFRLSRLIEEMEKKIDESKRSDEEYRRAQRLLEEGRRQDAKRLMDMQGEVAALRKRQDEQRGKVDLTSDAVRKLEMRFGEFQAAESERRQGQTAFVEKMTMWQVERDRTWKTMQTNFEEITKQAVNLDTQLQALDATHRSVKRSQEAFDDITQRFDRRVNEITEMQRLVEDRFRQEWVVFKADDQKRWTNYTLAQEEQQREFGRQYEKQSERIVLLEDVTQEMRDTIHQITEETVKRLQGLLALSHDWMEEYERTFGRVH